jgi:hypothetical protein
VINFKPSGGHSFMERRMTVHTTCLGGVAFVAFVDTWLEAFSGHGHFVLYRDSVHQGVRLVGLWLIK